MSVLRRIFDEKRAEVALAKNRVPESELVRQIEGQEAPRGFARALSGDGGGRVAGRGERELRLIAEVKKASPSQGLIRADFNPEAIAKAYERAGAACLSVLTDSPSFQGSLEDLAMCRRSTKLPCLRKDFIYDPYQVLEARAWGADAILLIAAMLDREQIRNLAATSADFGMDVLLELHSEQEVDLANEMGFDLVGVNNRDLSTFRTDLETSARLLPKVRANVRVSESALDSREDLAKVQGAGATAVLIGTAFCKTSDIEAAVKDVMGW